MGGNPTDLLRSNNELTPTAIALLTQHGGRADEALRYLTVNAKPSCSFYVSAATVAALLAHGERLTYDEFRTWIAQHRDEPEFPGIFACFKDADAIPMPG